MDSASTGAELFVETLERYGVTHVFGNPGTTELPIMAALETSELEFVLGLHEDIAVGMAAGYAQTRRYQHHEDPSIMPVGVVNLHVAPGLAHGLANLDAAAYGGVPLVVTAGDHGAGFRHEEPILHGDLVQMAEPFTKWSAEVSTTSTLPTMLRRAFRVALSPPTGPVFLSLPIDVQLAETDAVYERLGPVPTAGRGDPAMIERATALLVAADDVAMIVGDAIARAGTDAVDAAVALAEATGARVFSEILAGEIDFPTDHGQWLSFLPPEERLFRRFTDVDTIVLVGCSTNTTIIAHDRPLVDSDATCIHIGEDPWQVGKNQSADAAIVGDPKLVLGELAARTSARIPEATRHERVEGVRAFREETTAIMRSMGEVETARSRPSTADLVDVLRSIAPNAYVVDEGVSAKYALLTRWPFAPGQYIATKSGTLGYGVPAAVGAALAELASKNPRTVLGFVGDGSFQFYPQALYAAVRHGLDLTIVVVDNGGYRILKDNTVAMLGGQEDDYAFAGMELDPAVDIPAIARGYGASGQLVETSEGLPDAIRTALDQPGPSVLTVRVHEGRLSITTPH